MRGKMRGHLKRVGHCSVPGHGQSCCVTAEIREDCLSREQERREWERDVLTHPDVQAGFAAARPAIDVFRAGL